MLPYRLAAQTLRLLPRKQISQTLGRVAATRAPRPLVDAAIAAFVRSYDVNLDEAEIPAEGFETFDAFFTRRLRPGARPIDPDPEALVSPADGRLEDLGPISLDGELLVKGSRYTVADLLGDAADAAAYEGGRYFVVYLSPRDYHRVHAPTCGDVQYVRYVPGTLFPVNRIGTQYVPQLFARNERLAIVQESKVHGRVTTIMVGAIGVGRIGLSFDELQTNSGHAAGERRYDNASVVRAAGDELGVFHLGSTAVVLTTAKCRLSVEAEPNASVKMGEALARGRVHER
jgi:phosphatidylserine decarboxylase